MNCFATKADSEGCPRSSNNAPQFIRMKNCGMNKITVTSLEVFKYTPQR